MPDENVNIWLRVKEAGTAAFRRVDQGIRGIIQRARQGKLSFEDLQVAWRAATRAAAALAAGAIALAVGLAKLAQRGGEVVNVKRAFARVAGDATAALRTLRETTQGLISDYDLMVGFNRAVTLGAARTVDEFGQLARTALTLGRALGVDAAFAVESLSLGIGRQSKQILDNLGLQVKVEEANRRYAESIGRTVEQLDDAEKREAFRTAAMEAARVAIEQLGGVELTAADNVTRLATAFKNFRDRISEIVAQSPGVGRFFDMLVDGMERTKRALEDLLDPGSRLPEFTEQERPLMGLLLKRKEVLEEIARLQRVDSSGAHERINQAIAQRQQELDLIDRLIKEETERLLELERAEAQARRDLEIIAQGYPTVPAIEGPQATRPTFEEPFQPPALPRGRSAELPESRIQALAEVLAGRGMGLDEMIEKIKEWGVTEEETINHILAMVGELERETASGTDQIDTIWSNTVQGLVETIVNGGNIIQGIWAGLVRGLISEIQNVFGGGLLGGIVSGFAGGILSQIGRGLFGDRDRRPVPVTVTNPVRIDRSDEKAPTIIIQITDPSSGRVLEEFVVEANRLQSRGGTIRLPRPFSLP
jgi:hypothetical protein